MSEVNKQDNLKVTSPYIPDLGIKYPDNPDTRIAPFVYKYELNMDENYPFFDKSFKFRFMRIIIYGIIYFLLFPTSLWRFSLKIEGRKNLRKYKEALKNGAMTICNHVQRWDFLFVAQALRYRVMYFPVWKEQLKSPDRDLIRHAGGIPIPDDIRSIRKFNNAFDEIVKKKIWFHVFPEGCRWDYYVPIRPFKKGVFTMAYRYNLPVLPLAISYRKPVFPYTLVNFVRTVLRRKKLPMITIRIGEPLFFDTTLGRKEAVNKIRKECHEAVIKLAGVSSNPYPAEGD
jgi:1-acyl-sn-glycerol-3-phosphate acyltransferase